MVGLALPCFVVAVWSKYRSHGTRSNTSIVRSKMACPGERKPEPASDSRRCYVPCVLWVRGKNPSPYCVVVQLSWRCLRTTSSSIKGSKPLFGVGARYGTLTSKMTHHLIEQECGPATLRRRMSGRKELYYTFIDSKSSVRVSKRGLTGNFRCTGHAEQHSVVADLCKVLRIRERRRS